ncbi:uncharacterized protein B0H18DRAFT_1124959 [Fomitopsis serialis]|uniref:uncharacterized protein n=1 Tax=Fomitopsis serialis TaxID=139415 RepID=UPI0020080E43|nr:uncharacterized protein B0H18DRAFT_1124959 [Neoantrodia serialis]KAH9915373.1 hypothetical protein B0H18DRAFT_1124959 [Neoantrodia serialis]
MEQPDSSASSTCTVIKTSYDILHERNRRFSASRDRQKNTVWTEQRRLLAGQASTPATHQVLELDLQNMYCDGCRSDYKHYVKIGPNTFEDILILEDIRSDAIAGICTSMPNNMREHLTDRLTACFPFDPLKTISTASSIGDITFEVLHFSWYNRHCTQGNTAPTDVPPFMLGRPNGLRVNYAQMLPYTSKDMREHEDIYCSLRNVLGDVFEWLDSKLAAMFPNFYVRLEQFAEILPGNSAPLSAPFLGLVVNLNVVTQAHRDSKDYDMCLVLAVGDFDEPESRRALKLIGFDNANSASTAVFGNCEISRRALCAHLPTTLCILQALKMASRTRSATKKQAPGHRQTSQAATSAGQKGRARRQNTSVSPASESDVANVDTSGLSQSDAKALARLLKKAKVAKEAEAESHVKNTRKRVVDMMRDEESEDELKHTKKKKKKTGNRDYDGDADADDGDADADDGDADADDGDADADDGDADAGDGAVETKGSVGEDDELEVEETRVDEHRRNQGNQEKEIRSRPKPRPAYKGAPSLPRKPAHLDKEEASVAKSLGATTSSRGKSKASRVNEDSGDDGEEGEQVVRNIKKSTGKSKASRVNEDPGDDGGDGEQVIRNIKKSTGSSSSAKKVAPVNPPSPSQAKRKVYIDVPIVVKSPVRGTTSRSANDKDKPKKKANRFQNASGSDSDKDTHKSSEDASDDDDDDDEYAGSDGGKGSDEGGEDVDEIEDEDDDDGVVVLAEPEGKAKQKRSKGSRGRRERAKITNLPIAVRPLVTASQNCLRLRIALKTAWTAESSVKSGRLPKRDALIHDSLQDAHEIRDKDGKRIKALKTAFRLINGPKDEEKKSAKKRTEKEEREERERLALQQDVFTVVWASASQFRNELKKKAKVVVDQITHATDVLEGGSRNIPNFVFSDIDIVFDEHKRLDVKATTFNQDEPFRHGAIAELVYQHWALGARPDANLHAAMDEFRKVPDNLIAVVCNAIESALTDVVTNGQNFFTNKLFAAKWDGLMAILSTLKEEAPEHYKETKSIIWAQISVRLKATTVEDDTSDNAKGSSFLKIDRLRAKVGKSSPVQERGRATSISTTQAASASASTVVRQASSPRKSGGSGKPPSKPSSKPLSSSKTASGKTAKSAANHDVDVDMDGEGELDGDGERVQGAPEASGSKVMERPNEEEHVVDETVGPQSQGTNV